MKDCAVHGAACHAWGCARCGRRWCETSSRTVWHWEGRGILTLCVECWDASTRLERLRYYVRAWGDQGFEYIGQAYGEVRTEEDDAEALEALVAMIMGDDADR